MRPLVRKAVPRAYRLTTRPPDPEELVEVREGLTLPRFVVEWSRLGPETARVFLARLPAVAEVDGRSVIVVGRGAADLGIEVARRGARAVTAIEMAPGRDQLSRIRLEEERVTLPVEIRLFGGTRAELEGEPGDVILAADAFRSYGAARSNRDLEQRVEVLSGRLVDGGLLAIGFGPPWRSPRGGGLDSRLPWAHLIFPESVIFDEFRRARAQSTAETFEDIGINRITLSRFRRAMEASGLECVSVETNVGDSRAIRAMRALSRVPGLEEFLTQNLYGVWARR
jgi:predicted nicotinamide N-methyase